jgi:thioesterase domain-containing protein
MSTRLGRHDNFFMLGGHSLLAVRMINRIKSLMGFKLKLSALFEAPTIAELTPHLLSSGNTREDGFGVLLPIKPRGTRAPLFCVHHAFGLSWCFMGLDRHMHADQPLYGLQARGLFEESQPATTQEDMALDYISQIRRIQPQEPYNLLGYSFGGKVAHSMTSHLEQQGEKLTLLAILDSYPTANIQADGLVQEEDDSEEEARFLQLFANIVQDAVPDTARPLIGRAQHIAQLSRRRAESHSLLRCNSDMVLFRVMLQEDSTRQLISADDWKPFVMGEIDVYDINSYHHTVDQPASFAQIGGILAQRLDDIHAVHGNGSR